jgi:hypothetical protein
MDRNIPKDKSKFRAYLLKKNSETDAIDRKQQALFEENRMIRAKIKSTKEAVKLTQAILKSETNEGDQLQKQLEEIKLALDKK